MLLRVRKINNGMEWSRVCFAEPRFYVNSCDRSKKRQRDLRQYLCDCRLYHFHSLVRVEKTSDSFCFRLFIQKLSRSTAEQNVSMQIRNRFDDEIRAKYTLYQMNG